MSETLTYAPRKAIKSHALADFVTEWTDSQPPGSSSSGAVDDVLRRISHEDESWGRSAAHLTRWRPYKVCHQNTFHRI